MIDALTEQALIGLAVIALCVIGCQLILDAVSVSNAPHDNDGLDELERKIAAQVEARREMMRAFCLERYGAIEPGSVLDASANSNAAGEREERE